MNVNRHEDVFPFDVDNTLVMWENTLCREQVQVVCPHTGVRFLLGINRPMLELLITNKKRGSYIRVHSASGFAWAEAVVKALGLEQYVDDVESKPKRYADDKDVGTSWMASREYLGPEDNWRNR